MNKVFCIEIALQQQIKIKVNLLISIKTWQKKSLTAVSRT
jgi:hypothetical protein